MARTFVVYIRDEDISADCFRGQVEDVATATRQAFVSPSDLHRFCSTVVALIAPSADDTDDTDDEVDYANTP